METYVDLLSNGNLWPLLLKFISVSLQEVMRKWQWWFYIGTIGLVLSEDNYITHSNKSR